MFTSQIEVIQNVAMDRWMLLLCVARARMCVSSDCSYLSIGNSSLKCWSKFPKKYYEKLTAIKIIIITTKTTQSICCTFRWNVSLSVDMCDLLACSTNSCNGQTVKHTLCVSGMFGNADLVRLKNNNNSKNPFRNFSRTNNKCKSLSFFCDCCCSFCIRK